MLIRRRKIRVEIEHTTLLIHATPPPPDQQQPSPEQNTLSISANPERRTESTDTTTRPTSPEENQ